MNLHLNQTFGDSDEPDLTCSTNYIWFDGENNIEVDEDFLLNEDIGPDDFAFKPGNSQNSLFFYLF